MASIDPAYIRGNFEILQLDGQEGNLTVAETVTAKHFVGHREEKTITGDGQNVNFFVTHTLGVKDVHVSIYDSGDNLCLAAVKATSVGNIVVQFSSPPAEGAQFRIVMS